jgi:hypothetical protein
MRPVGPSQTVLWQRRQRGVFLALGGPLILTLLLVVAFLRPIWVREAKRQQKSTSS